MILKLSETLDVPLRDRNDLLTAAGFAPVFKTRPLDDPQMSQVLAELSQIQDADTLWSAEDAALVPVLPRTSPLTNCA